MSWCQSEAEISFGTSIFYCYYLPYHTDNSLWVSVSSLDVWGSFLSLYRPANILRSFLHSNFLLHSLSHPFFSFLPFSICFPQFHSLIKHKVGNSAQLGNFEYWLIWENVWKQFWMSLADWSINVQTRILLSFWLFGSRWNRVSSRQIQKASGISPSFYTMCWNSKHFSDFCLNSWSASSKFSLALVYHSNESHHCSLM